MYEQIPLGLSNRHGFLLEDFKGEKNKKLVHLLQNSSSSVLGRGLFLWGESGVGLTHLLQSLCYEFVMQGKKAFFWQAGMPMPDFDFLTNNWDLYVFDDLESILGDKALELLLYNAFNAMKEGALLIVGGQRPCSDLVCILSDLHSRLQNLVSQQVFPLTDNELIDLIRQRAKKLGHCLPDRLVQYMIRHYNRSAKYQLELLAQLDRQSWIDKKPISLSSLKTIVDA